MEQIPRATSVTRVARALIATVGVDDAVGILITQFSWDVAFAALANVDGPEAACGLWRAVEALLADEPAS